MNYIFFGKVHESIFVTLNGVFKHKIHIMSQYNCYYSIIIKKCFIEDT